ncbi:heavy metal translocating P-type ATPase [Polaromonas naphthalenivorans]|uniref:P-type Zn(2+) transporter n=1 Tax=Polaromonas naphthalenivorans (strain CJ2) TaxID=365044 RepID=A1VUG5_POLNA|nr:heavy metal translocating P-type ATPase [Polaromonas naphthalenivorans]ABM39293.1 heavy metal translocating P-type ATPase [Polaromonas naphthalenivorans CJ2]
MTDCCNQPSHTSAIADLPAAPVPAGATRFRIPAMDCAVEEADIRRVLAGVPGIRSLNFQLVARTLTIDAQAEALQAAVSAIGQAGYKMQPFTDAGPAGQTHGAHDHEHDHAHGHGGLPSGLPRLAGALGLAGVAEVISFFAPAGLPWTLAGMAVALAAIFMAGLEVYQKGLTALFRRRLNINALMTVAVTGAFLIGQWPEAAMVMALYSIAELIEAMAVDRARNAIKGLMALAPEAAELRQPDGQWTSVPLNDVPLGATVRVRPGGRIPLDGLVMAGASAVDQASVTGESLPVDKAAGDSVFGGTISQTGALELRVTAAASDSTLARIIHAVEQAQGARAPTQTFIDRFAAIYTPAVFMLALAVAVLTPLLLDWTWLEALYKALVLLVIACPCALVVSTPVTVVSGLTTAARRGILIKGGTYLEDARRLKAVALDKTGTITQGKPVLVAWQAWGGADQAEVGRLAATLAARSDHPVSSAIAQGLRAGNPQGALPAGAVEAVEMLEALSGRGVQGRIGGQPYALGNHRLMEERQQCSPALEAALALHEQQGRTVTLLASAQGVLGIFAVADTIKESSRQAIAELKALGVTPVMLSGDNAATASAVAAQAGIIDVRGNLLPEEKLAAIRQLQGQYGATGMIGDGINDAPALAQADIGFAMGGAGTDIAIEAADVVIMNDNLRRIAETVRLSRRTHAVLWQNIALALGIKAVFFVLAVFGSATMWMAVFADMGASLLVVANGLRLLRR